MKNFKKWTAAGAVLLALGLTSLTAFAASGTPAEIIAGLTGQSVESVAAEKTESGKTYGALAADAGKLEEFHAQILELKKNRLEERVEAGTMTEERAEAILTAMETHQAGCNGTGDGNMYAGENGSGSGNAYGGSNGNGVCDGTGDGVCDGTGDGNGASNGNGVCDGTGDGVCDGTGLGNGASNGNGVCDGTGDGVCDGTGLGNGASNGNGVCDGTGDGGNRNPSGTGHGSRA